MPYLVWIVRLIAWLAIAAIQWLLYIARWLGSWAIWLVESILPWIVWLVQVLLFATGLTLSRGKVVYVAIVGFILLFTRPDRGLIPWIFKTAGQNLSLWWQYHPVITTLLIASVFIVVFGDYLAHLISDQNSEGTELTGVPVTE